METKARNTEIGTVDFQKNPGQIMTFTEYIFIFEISEIALKFTMNRP